MKYYKVRKQYDNTQVTKCNRSGKIIIDRFLVGNELYTPAEFRKLTRGATFRGNGVKDDTVIFDLVEVNKNNTFWFFGARFRETFSEMIEQERS